MCQSHLIKCKNLRIGDSNIKEAGLGLFVGHKAISRNRIIAPYTGTKSKNPINGNYVLEVTKNKFINANRSTDVAGFANDCRAANRRNGECTGTNARYTFNHKNDTVNLVSTKRILPNAEVFVPYDMDFWRKVVKSG